MTQDPDPRRDAPTVDVPTRVAPVAPAAPVTSTAPSVAPSKAPSKAPSTAPSTDASRRSRSRAAWFALIVGVVVLIFMLIFILQNNVPAQFTFLAWEFTIPLGVAVLFAGIGGALVTALVGTTRMIVLGRNVRKLEQARATAV